MSAGVGNVSLVIGGLPRLLHSSQMPKVDAANDVIRLPHQPQWRFMPNTIHARTTVR